MAVLLGIVLLVGLLILASMAVLALRIPRRQRFQFSLRTLLIAVGLVAVLFSAWFSWRTWTTAQMTWLDPASPIVAQIRPEPAIIEEDGLFKASFRPRYRAVQDLVPLAERAQVSHPGMFRTVIRHEEQQVDFEASDRVQIEECMATMNAVDVPLPGRRAIHGRVEDAEGQPVSGAIVDLMGRYVYINHFRTRRDGTFTMPIQAPPGSGYYLRIRYGQEQRIETPTFSLEDEKAEALVQIHLR